MAHVITIYASAKARVTVQTIKDRERHNNGVTELDADEEGTFVVSDKQSLLIEAMENDPEPTENDA